MLRNGPRGYGWVTKSLHWATVLALVVQFVVGYVMDPDGGSGRGRGRRRSGESGRGRGRGGVAGHVMFFVALAVHVAMAVAKRLLPRML